MAYATLENIDISVGLDGKREISADGIITLAFDLMQSGPDSALTQFPSQLLACRPSRISISIQETVSFEDRFASMNGTHTPEIRGSGVLHKSFMTFTDDDILLESYIDASREKNRRHFDRIVELVKTSPVVHLAWSDQGFSTIGHQPIMNQNQSISIPIQNVRVFAPVIKDFSQGTALDLNVGLHF